MLMQPWGPLFNAICHYILCKYGTCSAATTPTKPHASLAQAQTAPWPASGCNGSPQHIVMALFDSQVGIQMTHVPYKGETQAQRWANPACPASNSTHGSR